MKAGLLCLAGLSGVAVAQPHHRRHNHLHRDVVTETDVAEATQNVMVYVNAEGVPTSTSIVGAASSSAAAKKYEAPHHHEGHPAAAYGLPSSSSSTSTSTSVYVAPAPTSTSTSSSSTSVYVAPITSSSTSVYVAPTTSSTTSVYVAPTTSTTSVYVAPTTSTTSVYVAPTTSSTTSVHVAPTTYSTTEVPTTTAAPTSTKKTSTTSSTEASSYSSPSSAPASGLGITYSPYRADGTCKTADEVMTDFDQLDGYSLVRTYGTDCEQVGNVLAAAKSKGIKLFAGIYDISDVVSELAIITEAIIDGDWSAIDTISIGNELINSGSATVPEVAAAVALAKTTLALTGFTGSIVTVDTFVAIISNPDLCEVGDYVAANCHAFFDGGVTASQAGEFVVSQTQRVSAACGGKKTIITESGWPSQGEANKDAVPSEANQEAAISSLKSSFSSGLFLFNAYNDMWKQDNSGTFGAEKYWGIYGMSAAN